jgi:transposase-like protein
MTTLMTEVVETGAKRDTRGRRIATGEERAAMIAAYASSGLTQRAFAEREGVKFCTFAAWLARDRRARGKARFAEVDLGRPVAAGIEVTLPDGLIVRGTEVEQLALLIGRLRRC